MARAFQQSQPLSDEHSPAEWGSLRQELVALLDQVDSRVAAARSPNAPERMADLRHQAVADEEDSRHRDALRSVQRALTRFEELQMPGPAAASPAPRATANPRDTLQAAIDQIRSRQDNRARTPEMPSPPPAPPQFARSPEPSPVRIPEPPVARSPEAPLFDKLAQSVNGLGGRLERLEAEIKAQIKAGANVKDVADQVSQLANVVELLAGAVGETGQVKKLEAQIASLGKIMAQGREIDIQTLTRRLDDLAGTVGKLAELQVHYTDKVQNPVETQAFKDGMASIEMSVRTVYDRIDSLERQRSLSPDQLDQVTAQMAKLTAELNSGKQEPLHLVELVDALNSRISDMESGDGMLRALRKDLASLRDTIIVSIAPRFEAIETRMETLSTREDMAEIGRQIGALGDRIEDRPIDPGLGQLEAQVRQLVARMDQTGEQLSGLAKLYMTEPQMQMPDFEAVADRVAARTAEVMQQQPQQQMPDFDAVADRVAARTAQVMQRTSQPMPDMNAMADMVAMRTFEAVQRHNPVDTALADTISGLEGRIAMLLNSMQRDPEVDSLDAMQTSIAEVNMRLARLEGSLMGRAAAAESHEAIRTADIVGVIAQAERALPAMAPVAAQPRARDAMPRDPSAEAPLNMPAFPEPKGPVGTALDAKNGPRKRHPGLAEDTSLAARYETRSEPPAPPAPPPGFEPERIAVPAAPQPSTGFGAMPMAELQPATVPVVAPPVPAAARNTFIEAARRAAQRQQQAPTAGAAAPNANSLIGRAMARFQIGNGDKTNEPLRVLPGDKPARTAFKPEPAPVAPVTAPAPAVAQAPSLEPQVALDGPAAKPQAKESFLGRNRKTILLGAAVVALGFLTANLVAQRMNQAAQEAPVATTDTAPVTTGDIANDVASPGVPAASGPSSMPPRVIPMVDSLKTGAIDQSAAQGFAPTTQAMPDAFSSPAVDAATQVATADPGAPMPAAVGPEPSPVKVEMPPDNVGPADLRAAASNGDPRSQFEVAAIYTEGRAVPKDDKAAATWYERAAAQGFAPAEYRLGSLYEQGQGVAKDLNAAKIWYEKAAEAGNRMSMHNLAALYASGQLGKQEFDSAAKWFEEAANRGLTDSQFNLGMLYARGLGVPQSLTDSYKWFGIAALSGDKDAIKARDDIARSLDADSVAKLSAEVSAFKPAPVDLVANFAPIGTWSKTFDPGETITTRDIVQSVQKALGKLGYDVGSPDGIAGAKTATAIKAFEKATGMTEVGQINPRLLAVLGSQPV